MQLPNFLKTSLWCAVFSTFFLLAVSPAFGQDRIRVSDAEGKKAVISRVEPSYPPMAKQMKISGHVEVDVEVNPEGHVEKVDVVNGNTILAGSCVSAVKKWTFSPFVSGGKPTVAVVRLGFNFTM
jgi:TonB family protein